MTTHALPWRVVDRDNQTWFSTLDAEGREVYSQFQGGEVIDYATLTAARSPLRPVLPVAAEDEERLGELLAAAGRRAITTLAAALDLVYYRLRRSHGWLDHAAESAEYGKVTLTAGRPGSWESAALFQIVLFGNGLNLADEGRDVEERRDAGPSTRVDADVRNQMAAMLQWWISDPDRYTEVAETLAIVVSEFCDDRHGPDGWRAVADQWLQSTSLHRGDYELAYGLFYSRSRYFEPTL